MNPEIREQYPSLSPYGQRGVGYGSGMGALAEAGTDAPPGSEGKILAMAERARQRQTLWHPGDAGWSGAPTESVCQQPAQPTRPARRRRVYPPRPLPPTRAMIEGRPLCQHCQRRELARPQTGLCLQCHAKPAIRKEYAARHDLEARVLSYAQREGMGETA